MESISLATTHSHDPRDARGPRGPSNLAFPSSIGSVETRSPELSPTKSRCSDAGETSQSVFKGPFIFVGPDGKRFHADRQRAPYPLPCGLEELSRYIVLDTIPLTVQIE